MINLIFICVLRSLILSRCLTAVISYFAAPTSMQHINHVAVVLTYAKVVDCCVARGIHHCLLADGGFRSSVCVSLCSFDASLFLLLKRCHCWSLKAFVDGTNPETAFIAGLLKIL